MRTTEDIQPYGIMEVDPEELWLDQDISVEELIERDPLEITREMLEVADHPELADPILAALPAENCRRHRDS